MSSLFTRPPVEDAELTLHVAHCKNFLDFGTCFAHPFGSTSRSQNALDWQLLGMQVLETGVCAWKRVSSACKAPTMQILRSNHHDMAVHHMCCEHIMVNNLAHWGKNYFYGVLAAYVRKCHVVVVESTEEAALLMLCIQGMRTPMYRHLPRVPVSAAAANLGPVMKCRPVQVRDIGGNCNFVQLLHATSAST